MTTHFSALSSDAAATVVILNWNGRKWLEQFLPGVAASVQAPHKVLLVDNASTDDSLAWARTHCPTVEILALDQNYGFTGGNNRALPHIDTRYLVLLNSDVEVAPGWLEPLVADAESDPKIAAVQPKVLMWSQKELFEYAGAAGGWVDSLAYPFCRGRLFDQVESDNGQYNDASDIFWATGACCLIRTEVAHKIGLLEEIFFAHMEEIDFCWRAQLNGYRIRVVPQSVVYHVGGGTLHKVNPFKTFLNVRNSLSMMYLNLHSGERLPRLFARLVLDGVWGVKALLGGQPKETLAILRGHFAFYGWLSMLRTKRTERYGPLGPEKSLPALTGVFRGSVVWQYFGRRKREFKRLPLV